MGSVCRLDSALCDDGLQAPEYGRLSTAEGRKSEDIANFQPLLLSHVQISFLSLLADSFNALHALICASFAIMLTIY